MASASADITVIVLVGDEALHIERFLEKIAPLRPHRIFIIESQRGDNTHELALSTAARLALPVETVWHDWEGNQARQFNWALDALEIATEWILRLDADEYLYEDTIAELRELVAPGALPAEVTSLSLSRARHIFGGEIRHGRDIEIIRAFRRGAARYAATEMDEHLVITHGTNRKLRGKFVDHSLLPFAVWQQKHRDYAVREAKMAIEGRCNANKKNYYRLPPYFRALAYFGIRYFLQLGFLDGLPGWRWNFWQALWYRWLVDREISRLKRKK